MKFYNENQGEALYKEVPHNCNLPTDTIHPFIVNFRDSADQRCGFSKDFLVFAKDADAAKANFLCNVVALGTAIKATLKPEDLLPIKGLANDPAKLAQASILRNELRECQDRFDTIFDDDGDIVDAEREMLVEKMEKLRTQIGDLEEKVEAIFPSRFERMMQRLTKLTAMHITARQLDTQRAYAVSYFDDARDYTSSAT